MHLHSCDIVLTVFLCSNSLLKEKWLLDHIAGFAVHTLVALVGKDNVRTELLHSEPAVSDEPVDASAVQLISLAQAASSFDGGRLYDGQFHAEVTAVSGSKFEARVKTSLHLVSQLCTIQPSLLTAYFDAYVCGVHALQMQLGASCEDAELRVQMFTGIITADLKSIFPVMTKHFSAPALMELVTGTADGALPLVQALLTTSHADVHLAADRKMPSLAHAYVLSHPALFGVDSMIQSEAADLSNEKVLAFFQPVLSGFTEEEIIKALPSILKAHNVSSNTDLVKGCLTRLIQARPPSISKALLLTSLHRLA